MVFDFNLAASALSTQSERKWETAEVLFAAEKYADALFFCHLAIELRLKGLVAKATRDTPPYIHDLPRLALLAQLELSAEKKADLAEISTFNIRARYDDYKLMRHKKATKEFAEKYMTISRELLAYLSSSQ